jgi:hypothetical protein
MSAIDYDKLKMKRTEWIKRVREEQEMWRVAAEKQKQKIAPKEEEPIL